MGSGVYMKRKFSVAFVFGLIVSSLPGYADDNISINYGVGSTKGKHSLQGVNAEFLHQKDNIGVIGSATYLSKTDGEYVKTQYASIQVGPSFALSDSFFLYGKAGISAASKLKDDQPNEKYGVAFSTGVKYKLVSNVTLNAGYELGIINDTTINVAYLGVGYSF